MYDYKVAPKRVRGLKLTSIRPVAPMRPVAPKRVRGLKHRQRRATASLGRRTQTGAWIETKVSLMK